VESDGNYSSPNSIDGFPISLIESSVSVIGHFITIKSLSQSIDTINNALIKIDDFNNPK
jgi:hypothetical protein